MNTIRIKYGDLSDVLISKADLEVYIKDKFQLSNDFYNRSAKPKITRFVQTHNTKFKAECHGKKEAFLSKNKEWLDRELTICCNTNDSSSDESERVEGTDLKGGKRLKSFENCSERSKRRRCQELQASTSELQIERTFFNLLRKNDRSVDVKIIKQLAEINTERKQEILKIIQKNTSPKSYTPDEALALFIDGKMTKYQYETLTHGAAERDVHLYPSYHRLLESKKQCYPDKRFIQITDTRVTIQLQALLNLTCERLIKAYGDSMQNCGTGDELTFYYKWGMDGASGQSEYKQLFKDCPDNATDSSIIMIALVPLQIRSTGLVLWQNEQASSTKFCRPIRFLFEKESKLIVQREYKSIQEEIKTLIPTSITVNGREMTAKHLLTMTMVDGKLINELTDTSDSNCNICGARPTQMNDFELIAKFKCNNDNFSFGVSSLHCWIRFMECLLKIAFRIPVTVWKVSDQNDKDKVDANKKRIQKAFRLEKGLLLSVVKRGAGTTNDGNTARAFFKDPAYSAKVTQLNEELINRFRVILIAMSSGVDIDVTAFQRYANETAKLYKKHYNWYCMPPSVHKVLFHGSKIIESLNLPIGLYSEEAQESRNKDFKRIRLNNTRKMSRIQTNEDILHGLLVSSDPYISSLRKTYPKEKEPFDAEVSQLFKI